MGGAANSFIGKLEAILDINAGWRAHCIAENITKRSGNGSTDSYQMLCFRWLKERYQGRFEFSSANAFECGLSLRNKLQEHK
eukprot:8392838-Alexandrium_andersonii.AAC.1